MSDAARWIDPEDMPDVQHAQSPLDARAAERLGDHEALAQTLGEAPADDTPVEDRRGYIGGSDAAAICGLSPWKQRAALYLEKIGEVEPTDLSGVERVYWGTTLEAIVADEYAKRTGLRVRRVNRLLKHKEYPFIAVHLDRMVLDGARVLECKTTDWSKRSDWGEPGTGEIPDYYLPQTQHALLVTGREQCDVAVLFGGNEFAIYHVRRDEEFIAGLLALEVDFWLHHVVPRIPPAPESSDEARLVWPTTRPGEVMASEQAHMAAKALVGVKQRIKELQAEQDGLELVLKEELADQGDTLVYNGRKLATWKQAERTSLNQKLLQTDHPQIAEAYEHRTTYRSFRFSYKPEKE